MKMDKTTQTEWYRTFLVQALPEPLTRSSSHLQIFDNYILGTRLRLRLIRVPETKEWSYILQQKLPVHIGDLLAIKTAEIRLNEQEYEHFKIFEGNEIRKNRYFHEFDGRMFDFDVYLGPLWGLNRARAQFDTAEEMTSFEPPPWVFFDVSSDQFFDDANLTDKNFDDIRSELEKVGGLAMVEPRFPDE